MSAVNVPADDSAERELVTLRAENSRLREMNAVLRKVMRDACDAAEHGQIQGCLAALRSVER